MFDNNILLQNNLNAEKHKRISLKHNNYTSPSARLIQFTLLMERGLARKGQGPEQVKAMDEITNNMYKGSNGAGLMALELCQIGRSS